MSGRCSPTDALNLLIPAFEPMKAATRLTDAIHDPDVCRLWCDGKLVPADFVERLKVVARLDDGRRTARIVSAVGEAWDRPADKQVSSMEFTGIKLDELGGDMVFQEVVKPPYQWEFEIDQVKALLPQQPTTRRKEPREYEEIRQLAARKWPRGYKHIAIRHIIAAANSDEEFKEKVSPFPSRYQFERALDRRKK
jgi:hypothetical protein